MPISALDITDMLFKEVEKYFTHTAYRKIWQSGKLISVVYTLQGVHGVQQLIRERASPI